MASTRVLRREYTGNLCLKTTDHCIKTSLLPKFAPKPLPNDSPKAEFTFFENEQFLLELGDVLSSNECAEIIKNTEKCAFEDISDKYRFGKQRNSLRLLALDKILAENLWQSIYQVLFDEINNKGVSIQPLGFDVTRGVWDLDGLNEAIRVNKYSGKAKGFFGPHKDAQYCPNGDERSIMTLLVYLNDNFKGGETCFYFPKDSTVCSKGETIKQEIKLHGGLKNGYKCVKIVPKVGHAVLSSQSILHEALPVRNGSKYILKTDVVVKRCAKEFGFAVMEGEKKDYMTCLNYFRQAQQQELDRNFNVASDLYEKALSIRYCYPNAISGTSNDNIDTSGHTQFPSEVWLHLFNFLSGYDVQNIVYAYPELSLVMATWEQRRRNSAPNLLKSNVGFLPKIRYQKGVRTSFEFPDAEFFKEKMTECCRVAAMYTFFLLGHSPQDDVYTVRYNPDTREVCIVPLELLLTDVFYGQRCYGSVFIVKQQDPKRRDPKKDFEASVDRDYMFMKHGAEFTGVGLSDAFHTKSMVHITVREQDSDKPSSDEDDDYDEDDDSDDSEDANGDDFGNDNENIGACDGNNDDINDDGGNDEDTHDDDDDNNGDCGDDGSDGDNGCEDGLSWLDESARRKIGVYYDNILPFYGEVDKNIPINQVIQFLLASADNNNALFQADDSELDEIFDEDSEDLYKDNVARYLKTMEEDNNYGSCCTLVSKLNTPLSFRPSEVCVCFMKDGTDDAADKLANNCSTEVFNHLLFDFQKSQMNVEIEEDRYEGGLCWGETPHSHSCDMAIQNDMDSIGCTGKMVLANVNIEPILSPDTSFNHASCQCGHPRFELQQFYTLKHYLHLTTLTLFAKEKDGKMIVWTVYNGIVAL